MRNKVICWILSLAMILSLCVSAGAESAAWTEETTADFA